MEDFAPLISFIKSDLSFSEAHLKVTILKKINKERERKRDRYVQKVSLEDIGNVSLAHIYREGNDLADSLAKAGVDRSYMLEKSFISGL